MKSQSKKLMLTLLINTVLMVAIYFAVPYLLHVSFLPILYAAIGVGLLLYYLIYNRGFVARGITAEDLPDSMSAAEKQDYLETARLRFEKSRWVLTVLLPIILTFIADVIYLFVFPMLEGLFA